MVNQAAENDVVEFLRSIARSAHGDRAERSPYWRAADELMQLRLDVAQQIANVAHYKAMFESAAVSMDSCACQWEPRPDNPAEHTDRIVTLCLAHQEYFEKRPAVDVGDKP